MKFRPKLLPGLILLVLLSGSVACSRVTQPSGWASPYFDDDVVYVFDDEELSALQLNEQGIASTLWQFPNDNLDEQKDVELDAVYGTPVRDGDLLYVAGFAGEVDAIEAATGRLVWRQDDFEGEVVGDLTLADGRLFFTTLTGRLYALNPADGNLHAGWPAEGVKVGNEIWAPPVVIGDRVFAATMSGEVHAYNTADGTSAWDEPFEKAGAIADLAAVGDSTLFVPGFNSHVNLIDANTGDEIASFKASDWIWTRPFVAGNIAYFGDFSGSVFALDITTGVSQWTYDADAKVKAAPVVIDNTLVLATEDGTVHFVDATSGVGRNEVPLQDAGSVRANLTARDGLAYVVDTDGQLFRADPATLTVVEVPAPEQAS